MNNSHLPKIVALGFCGMLLNGVQSHALAVSLNYEGLFYLEEPLAMHVNDTTISLSGVVDGSVDLNSDDDDAFIKGNLQVNAETQWENSLTVGATYFAELDSSKEDKYNVNVAAYVRGILGTIAVGDVTGTVREDTRRKRGTGNAALSYDDSLAAMNERGIAYIGRYGPLKISATADEDGHFSVGATYQRPLGNKDYRFSAKLTEAEYLTSDATSFDSTSFAAIAELTYGSTVYDLGIGIEELSEQTLSISRRYASIGLSTKVGLITWSAAAHLGDIEGQKERSYALGARYDISRGLSLNLGINHRDSQIIFDEVELLNDDATEALFSVRYSY